MKNDFKPVFGFRDLAQFGITGLTGEACAYSMRTLCDVNEEGKALLAEFFGMPELTLAKNMNSTVDGKPSIGSIMLTHDIVPKLAQFAFFTKDALAVVISGGREINGLFEAERVQQYRDFIEQHPNETSFDLVTNHAIRSSAPMVGSRNVHMATGRAI
jgi:hypothetical protein